MADTKAISEANEDQEEYWNSGPGQKWVTFQDSLDAVLHPAGARLLERALPAAGERVLEVGCGTGAVSMELTTRVGTEGSVVGADISDTLLSHAIRRKAEGGYGNLEYLLSDAQTHAFEKEDFDLVLSRFGVMFFNDPVAAFRNLAMALRPGGRLSFVSWAPMPDNPWFDVPRKVAVERLGPAEPTPPTAPGPFAFKDVDYVLDILRNAGFPDVTADVEGLELHYPGNLEEAAALTTNIGPSARIVKQYDGTAEDVAAISQGTAKALKQYVTGDGLRVPATLNFFDAVKPTAA